MDKNYGRWKKGLIAFSVLVALICIKVAWDCAFL